MEFYWLLLIFATSSPLWHQEVTWFDRQTRWKVIGEAKLFRKQISDRNKILDFHSGKLITGALLIFQDQKPVLMITLTLVMIQSFHSGLSYTAAIHENKGIEQSVKQSLKLSKDWLSFAAAWFDSAVYVHASHPG